MDKNLWLTFLAHPVQSALRACIIPFPRLRQHGAITVCCRSYPKARYCQWRHNMQLAPWSDRMLELQLWCERSTCLGHPPMIFDHLYIVGRSATAALSWNAIATLHAVYCLSVIASKRSDISPVFLQPYRSRFYCAKHVCA